MEESDELYKVYPLTLTDIIDGNKQERKPVPKSFTISYTV